MRVSFNLWLINNILACTFFSGEIPWEASKRCKFLGRLELSNRSYRGCCSRHEGMLRPFEYVGLACCTQDKEVLCDDGETSPDCYCHEEFKIQFDHVR